MRVTRVVLQLEDHHAGTDPDLRGGDAGAAQVPHGVVHIGDQRGKLRIKAAHRQRHLPQQRLAHLQYRPYRHRRCVLGR